MTIYSLFSRVHRKHSSINLQLKSLEDRTMPARLFPPPVEDQGVSAHVAAVAAPTIPEAAPFISVAETLAVGLSALQIVKHRISLALLFLWRESPVLVPMRHERMDSTSIIEMPYHCREMRMIASFFISNHPIFDGQSELGF